MFFIVPVCYVVSTESDCVMPENVDMFLLCFDQIP